MAARRANGEGSISKRKDGRWEAAIFARTASGVSKRRRIYARTRQEVHEKLTELKAKAQQGIPPPDKPWRLGEYLDYWLENVIQPNRRLSTCELYESIIRLWIKPNLGRYHLTRLTVPVLQGFLKQQQANGRSLRRTQTMREVISSALTNAMREEIVTRNVARLVVLPGRQHRDIRPWSDEEAIRFLEIARSHWLCPAFVLLLLYGLRRGEALGLRWQDVDFSQHVLRIRQQVRRVGGSVQVGPLKTTASQRDLPLIDLANQVLSLQWIATGKPNAGLVFTRKDSRQPLEPFTLSRSFRQICTRNNLRRIRLHDLRHTTATALKRRGIQARDVQLILGHSNISTTQQIYQHDDMDSRREGLEKLEQAYTVRGGDETGSRTTARYLSAENRRHLPALPSELPSNLTLGSSMLWLQFANAGATTRTTSVIEAGSRLALFGDPAENRTPIARMKTRNSAHLHPILIRATEVNALVEARRRQWLVGLAAVNAAVNVDARLPGPAGTPTERQSDCR